MMGTISRKRFLLTFRRMKASFGNYGLAERSGSYPRSQKYRIFLVRGSAKRHCYCPPNPFQQRFERRGRQALFLTCEAGIHPAAHAFTSKRPRRFLLPQALLVQVRGLRWENHREIHRAGRLLPSNRIESVPGLASQQRPGFRRECLTSVRSNCSIP